MTYESTSEGAASCGPPLDRDEALDRQPDVFCLPSTFALRTSYGQLPYSAGRLPYIAGRYISVQLHRGGNVRLKSLLAFAAPLALASVVLVVPAAVGAQAAGSPGTYIVQMAQSPVVAYTGGVAGLNATKPAKGQKINPASPDVAKYVGHLNGDATTPH